MSDPVDSLVKDLVNWIGDKPIPYAEVMEAWKTSCPKLPVWERPTNAAFSGSSMTLTAPLWSSCLKPAGH